MKRNYKFIIGGLLIFLFLLPILNGEINTMFYFPINGEAIGYDLYYLGLLCGGIGLIISYYKDQKNIKKNTTEEIKNRPNI